MAKAVSEVNKAIKTSLAAEYAGVNGMAHFKGKSVFLSFMGASMLAAALESGYSIYSIPRTERQSITQKGKLITMQRSALIRKEN